MKSVYSVTQINSYIKNMFRQDYMLQSILVRGEVSNCTYHSSGHIYFTLKDEGGTLKCAMWSSSIRNGGLKFQMKEGDRVIAAGAVDVYEKTGSYQFYAKQIIRDGAGELNEKYEKLKSELEARGMFDEQYKLPIPKYIKRLGVVTAPTGAAVQDICNISLRRDPYLQIILYPAIVQGEGAAPSVVNGIRALCALPAGERPDIIIIGRGGGSIEDLWAFNEEQVAEAVFDCDIPIISAVGHETDTVITDYVADLRAPTPSAAAELAVFEYSAFEETLESYVNALTGAMTYKTERLRGEVRSFERVISHLAPEARIRERRMTALQSEEKLQSLMKSRIDRSRGRLDVLTAGLDGLSPLKRLKGGFGYVTGEDGRAVVTVNSVNAGDELTIRLADGSIKTRAGEITNDSVQATESDAKGTDG